ncbi:MAG: hypothetical protein WBG90_15235 [Saonia sp.]
MKTHTGNQNDSGARSLGDTLSEFFIGSLLYLGNSLAAKEVTGSTPVFSTIKHHWDCASKHGKATKFIWVAFVF